MTKDIATVKAALERARVWDVEGAHYYREALKALSRLETALSSPPAAPTPDNNGWCDISTAPRDGTTIWGAESKNGYRGMVHFNGHEWELVDEFTNLPKGVGFYPTNWQPLPPPPALDKGE